MLVQRLPRLYEIPVVVITVTITLDQSWDPLGRPEWWWSPVTHYIEVPQALFYYPPPPSLVSPRIPDLKGHTMQLYIYI